MQTSAGILLFRRIGGSCEVLLVHPGGPFWSKKDEGAWSLPKGIFEPGEDPLSAAKREFHEETGQVPEGDFQSLGEFKQPSGKVIVAFGLEGNFDTAAFSSNTFTMEWPPKSGRIQEFPEVDQVDWFPPGVAMRKVLKGQVPILTTLFGMIGLSTHSAIPRRSDPEIDPQGSLF